MKKGGNVSERLAENPLVKQLIEGGAANSLIYWGYIGPPTTASNKGAGNPLPPERCSGPGNCAE